MYTSDKSALSKPLRGYLWSALGCAVFSAVYEHFSHGVYSWYMVFLFAVPLIYGLVPFLFSRTALSRRSPGAAPRRLYRWSAATLTVGCCFQGALEIYGTGSGLVKFYPIATGALLMAAGAVGAAEAARRKRLENEE